MRLDCRRRARRSGAAACAALACAGILVAAATPVRGVDPGAGFAGVTAGDEPVVVDADEVTYDRKTETIRAKGDVVVTAGEAVLAADRIEIERDTGEAEASGQVVLEDPEARIRAQRARLELEGETGVLENGEVYLPRSRFQLGGDRMEKGFGQSYRISDGILTTCLCGEGHAPDWSIQGEEVDLDIGGWGHVRDGVFRVKDVPVLYLPYGLFPVRRERQSGFLFPQFGISNARGFQYVQPFYWAIDKSSDATISLDVETSARLGLLGEYRYALAPDAGGNLTASYFNEKIGGDRSDEVVNPMNIVDPDIPTNRWSVIGYHQQTGPWDTLLYAQPFVVSDKLFLRDMNTLSFVPATNLLTSTQRYTISEAGALRSWSWGYLRGEARYFQDLIQKQSRVPQPLPRITFHAAQGIFDRRLTLGLDTQAVYYYRGPLSSGPRFDFAPQLMLPYRAGPYGFGDVRLILRETAYYLVNNDLPVFPQTPQGTLRTREVERFQHREILQLSGSFNSEVNRVFDVNYGELQKLKHTIEPFVRYNYIPVVNQNDLPLYDYYDRVNARNLVTYGTATRLLGKFGAADSDQANPPPSVGNEFLGNDLYGPAQPPRLSAVGGTRIRELARAYVQNSYSLTSPIAVPKVGTDEDDEDDEAGIQTINTHFTGIDAGLQVTPVTFAAARSRAVYSVAQDRLLFAEVGAHVFDPRPIPVSDDLSLPGLRPTNSASIFYQFNSGGTVENVNLATTFRVTDRVAISYFGRFDALVGRFLENWGGLRIISGCDCWVLDLAFVDRSNPDEFQVRVLFSLVGLGSFGQQPFQPGLGSFAPPTNPAADYGDLY